MSRKELILETPYNGPIELIDSDIKNGQFGEDPIEVPDKYEWSIYNGTRGYYSHGKWDNTFYVKSGRNWDTIETMEYFLGCRWLKYDYNCRILSTVVGDDSNIILLKSDDDSTKTVASAALSYRNLKLMDQTIKMPILDYFTMSRNHPDEDRIRDLMRAEMERAFVKDGYDCLMTFGTAKMGTPTAVVDIYHRPIRPKHLRRHNHLINPEEDLNKFDRTGYLPIKVHRDIITSKNIDRIYELYNEYCQNFDIAFQYDMSFFKDMENNDDDIFWVFEKSESGEITHFYSYYVVRRPTQDDYTYIYEQVLFLHNYTDVDRLVRIMIADCRYDYLTILGTGFFGTDNTPGIESGNSEDDGFNDILAEHNFVQNLTNLYLTFYNLKVPNLPSRRVLLDKFYY